MDTKAAQPTGKPAEERPRALPSGIATAPAPDPTLTVDYGRCGRLLIFLMAARRGDGLTRGPESFIRSVSSLAVGAVSG